MNIIIRTAVVDSDSVEIGAGGAIVLQSEPEEEYAEMRLKASALIHAIGKCSQLNSGTLETKNAGIAEPQITVLGSKAYEAIL